MDWQPAESLCQFRNTICFQIGQGQRHRGPRSSASLRVYANSLRNTILCFPRLPVAQQSAEALVNLSARRVPMPICRGISFYAFLRLAAASPPSPYVVDASKFIVVIICDGMFEMDAERNWTYVDGKTKARLIHLTYNELLEIAYEATSLNPNQFRIKMKFIVRSCYKLDPIEIENDGDVKCFFKEHFRVDTMHTSPLFIEVGATRYSSEKASSWRKRFDPAIPFASGRIDFQRRYQ
ncbi:hypothetical protein FNV43_RR18866 [Rhamnella rubrinervis]|uniref:Uncharacterized protein n=1 Tax=Rhamnella rubrinervis TaxID=2594499 RepID=A0A8K0DZT1_9ROSA|nr:hypothetical protein FNV43_RR18866 [Rhamnella rubrinervis]